MIRLNFNETGIEMRSTNFILTVIVILTNSFYIFAQPQELDLLVEEAIRLSPRIKMLEAKRSAAYNGIDKNSNLPDPVLTLGLVNIPTNTFSFDQDPMTQKFVGWHHILGLKKWENPIARTYQIYATPTYIVLDKNKKIIAKPETLVELKKIMKYLE